MDSGRQKPLAMMTLEEVRGRGSNKNRFGAFFWRGFRFAILFFFALGGAKRMSGTNLRVHLPEKKEEGIDRLRFFTS